MTPAGQLLALLAVTLTIMLPRPLVSLAVVGTMCYVTQGQAMQIFGSNITVMRLILLVGIARVIAKGEMRKLKLCRIDKVVLWYLGVTTLIYAISRGSIQALIYQLGLVYDASLAYFFFRSTIQTRADVVRVISSIAILAIPFAIFMTVESITGRNVFSIFGGGVPEISMFRDGHYRCQGAFRSPITAGTFGAVLAPLYVALFFAKISRFRAAIGIIVMTVITIAAHSSGPLLAYAGGMAGVAFWRYRRFLRAFRWGTVISLFCLHLAMKAPVWFVMARVSDVIGGGGWHRAFLIDQTVTHFDMWWLAGTEDTGNWMPYQLEDGKADITNGYIVAGLRGGLLSMILYIWIIVQSFSEIGKAISPSRGPPGSTELILWGLGCSLFANVVNLFSVPYFDQIEVLWYLLLAAIASATIDTNSLNRSTL